MDEQGYHSNSHTRTARGQEYQQRVVGRMRCRKEGQRRQETRSADLHELHEEVDVLGVELLAQVVHCLVHVLRQRVPLAAPDEVALAPDPLHVLPRRRRRRRRRDDDISAVSTGLRRGKGRRGCPERKGLFCALLQAPLK